MSSSALPSYPTERGGPPVPGGYEPDGDWAVTVDEVTKRYGSIDALDGVSLRVAPGEVFGLLGHNGAGKSTLIRILTGRAKPTAGTARVLGFEVPKELEGVRGHINLVAETPNIYQRSTAKENLELFCTLYGVPKSRAAEVLERVRLTEAAKRKVKGFSTGMRQRLLLARALLNDPRVLFLDEPTRGLDPRSAHELREIVTELAEGGSTIFLTTHDMNEADALCDRVAFLADGRVVALDTPQKLKLQLGGGPPDADVLLDDGEERRFSLSSEEEATRLHGLVAAGRVRAIHTREPTLADVFISLAGRSLDEDQHDEEQGS